MRKQTNKTSKNAEKRAEKAHSAQQKAKGERRDQSRASSATEVAGVAVATKNRTKNAKIEYAKDGKTCLIEHRERFATILGSTGFASNAFPINPGQSATFPWLSGLANRFESYKFEQLIFEFKTKTATTALGDVILAVDYDATDAAPSDSIQAEAYDESASAAPWQNVSHFCKKVNLSKLPQFYVRGDTQAANTDLKMSDCGNLFVCTENQASAALVGYMYVSYRVRFFTPQLRSNDIQVSGGNATGATAMTAANPFGTGATFDAASRGVTINGSSVITFVNPGSYLMFFDMAGTVLTAINKVDSAGITSTVYDAVVNAAGTAYLKAYTVVSTVANATVSITATATTVTAMNCLIGSVPSGSLTAWIEKYRLQEHKASYKLTSMACLERMRLRKNACDTSAHPCPAGCWCSE